MNDRVHIVFQNNKIILTSSEFWQHEMPDSGQKGQKKL